VFLAIRQYFWLSVSISGYPPVFLAIRQCFWLSASVSGYPPVFLAIRQCFWPYASISGYPPVFLAIRQYFSLSASISYIQRINTYYDLYQDYISSCVLRIARDMFALLPVSLVNVHAYEDRLNTATGYQERVAILSVKYDRMTLNLLNLTNLDPSDALTNFNYQMKFKKTQGFEEVPLVLS
jgi:hypothetical protein